MDSSCTVDLIREAGHRYFLSFLTTEHVPTNQVHILPLLALLVPKYKFTCFTSTKVQILTAEEHVPTKQRALSLGILSIMVSEHADAKERCIETGLLDRCVCLSVSMCVCVYTCGR